MNLIELIMDALAEFGGEELERRIGEPDVKKWLTRKEVVLPGEFLEQGSSPGGDSQPHLHYPAHWLRLPGKGRDTLLAKWTGKHFVLAQGNTALTLDSEELLKLVHLLSNLVREGLVGWV